MHSLGAEAHLQARMLGLPEHPWDLSPVAWLLAQTILPSAPTGGSRGFPHSCWLVAVSALTSHPGFLEQSGVCSRKLRQNGSLRVKRKDHVSAQSPQALAWGGG